MPHFFVLYEGAFDLDNLPPTYCGLVPQLLHRWPGALVSFHPSHAVVALGPEAEYLVEGHHRVSAVGINSPIDRMAKLGGKVLLLGVNQRVNTTIHTGEAYAAVPYWGQPRPDRPQGRWAIIPGGQNEWVPLPETPGDSDGFQKIEPFLVERQLVTIELIGRARCRLMVGQPLIEAVVDYLHLDPASLLCDRETCTFCSWARNFVPGPFKKIKTL
jgi:aminoglycoside N3'-acetyltransferase